MSANGTWHEWLIYFLNGAAVLSEEVLPQSERINALLNKWKMQIVSSASKVLALIVQEFAVNPYLTANRIAEELEISYSTAQRGIQKLENAKIITQINSSKRDKNYCATKMLSVLEEPTPINCFKQSLN